MQRSSFRRTLNAIVLTCCTLSLASAAGVFDLNGNPVDPLQQARGFPAIFIFVRTDCPISNRYAPEIQRMEKEYSAQANFWLVYPGQSQSVAAIRKHMEEFRYHAKALRDTRLELTSLSGAKVTPEGAVFNAAGKLIYHGRIDNRFEDFGRARASATSHELDDAIHAAIRGTLPAVAQAPGVGCSLADLE